jgi:arylsulfatase A-like enzyme
VPGKAKGSLYEGGIHVPLIISGWDAIPSGSRCGALVQLLDIFSTVADFAGVDVRAELAGITVDAVSLRPLLADPTAPSTRKYLYSEVFNPIGLGTPNWHSYAIRDVRYKLIVDPEGQEALYDLELDPTENSNLLLGPLTAEQQAAYDGLVAKVTALLASR